MEQLNRCASVLLVLVMGLFFVGCDSVGDISDEGSNGQESVLMYAPSNLGVAAKAWEGCDAETDPLCKVDLGDGWTVTFTGLSFADGLTTYTYDIFMPEGGNQSGKVALGIPECCVWSETWSEGNNNGNAAGDVEFNPTTTGVTTIQYRFEGDYWVGAISAGLKINSSTDPPTQPIYGPALYPTFDITGTLFLDKPTTELTDGPDGLFDEFNDATVLTGVVSLFDEYGGREDQAVVDGKYLFNKREGTYTIEFLNEGDNTALFNTSNYLPTTGLVHTVALTEASTDNDFGFMESYSIEGHVFLDLPDSNGGSGTGDGVFDPSSESGLGNVVVSLMGEVANTNTVYTNGSGYFVFEGLNWDEYSVRINANGGGQNALLFNEASFSATLINEGGYFTLFDGLVTQDVAGKNAGFEVNVKAALEAFEGGYATSTGQPREFWRVQATRKGSPKYRIPFFDENEVSDILAGIASFSLDGTPVPFGLTGLTVADAIEILKTDSKSDPKEALRTEILVALLNFVSSEIISGPHDVTFNTFTVNGDTFDTRFFIEHGISVLSAAGYEGVNKISSGAVSEGEKLLETVNDP